MSAADELLVQVRDVLPSTTRIISCVCCCAGIDDAEVILTGELTGRPLVLCRACARLVQRRLREVDLEIKRADHEARN